MLLRAIRLTEMECCIKAVRLPVTVFRAMEMIFEEEGSGFHVTSVMVLNGMMMTDEVTGESVA